MDCAWEVVVEIENNDNSAAMVSSDRPNLGTMVSPLRGIVAEGVRSDCEKVGSPFCGGKVPPEGVEGEGNSIFDYECES